MSTINVDAIRDRYNAVSAQLSERGRRLFAAAEAKSAAQGGVAAVVRAAGIAASTIGRGLKELAQGSQVPDGQVRRFGGGCKALTAKDATFFERSDGAGRPWGTGRCSRLRLWKYELQQLADELQIDICVHHFPPGTSKWNKTEHRLFSFMSMDWRAKPLVSYRVIVDLISATTTETGLNGAL